MNNWSIYKNLFFATLTFIALSGCVSIAHLEQAQDAFSKGAELENSLKFDTRQSITGASPGTYYAMAYASVKKALDKSPALEKDLLLGNAQALKALCEWKLKDYNNAEQSALVAYNTLGNYEKEGLYLPREKAMMMALKGLILIETSGDSLALLTRQGWPAPTEAVSRFEQLIAGSEGKGGKIALAMDILEDAAQNISPDHDVQAYLVLCRLSGLKVWSDGIDFVKNSIDEDRTLDNNARTAYYGKLNQSRQQFLQLKENGLRALAGYLPQKDSNPTYRYWQMILR